MEYRDNKPLKQLYRDHKNSYFIRDKYLGRPCSAVECNCLVIDELRAQNRQHNLLKKLATEFQDDYTYENSHTSDSLVSYLDILNRLLYEEGNNLPKSVSKSLLDNYIAVLISKSNTIDLLPSDSYVYKLVKKASRKNLETAKNIQDYLGIKYGRNQTSTEYRDLVWYIKIRLYKLGVINKSVLGKIPSLLPKTLITLYYE